MSDEKRVMLVGATGLVGRQVMAQCVGRRDIRLLALSRREVPIPKGARMEVLVADPSDWERAIAAIAPDYVICALGTTIAKMGGNQSAFAAVDRDLVLALAGYAKVAGVQHFAIVSSVGADRVAKNFYLRTKGEMEHALARVGFSRLDILRPGMLRGPRVDDRRLLEKLGMFAAPLLDLFLHGQRRKYRSVRAEVVADAALQAVSEKASGKFVHHFDDIQRLNARFHRS